MATGKVLVATDNNASGDAETETETETETDDVADAIIEKVTSDIISVVRVFIEVLRLEFNKQQLHHQQDDSYKQQQIVPLYNRMQERGLLERVRSTICLETEQERVLLVLLKKTRKDFVTHQNEEISPPPKDDNDNDACDAEEDAPKQKPGRTYNNLLHVPVTVSVADDLVLSNDFESQREKVMLNIALPLAEVLARWYKIIDDILPTRSRRSLSARNNRHKPPAGMISVQDYTDIACFLEFIVCTAILPSLVDSREDTNSNKYTSSSETSSSIVEDRIRTKLPKSLAGRIPKNALRWGITTTLCIDESFNTNNTVRNRNENGDTNSSNNETIRLVASTTSVLKATQKEEHKLHLLVLATEALTKLVLLDRFRPMLLPRHVYDIYRGCFRAEYMASQSDRIQPTNTTITWNDTNRIKMIIDPVYYTALGLSHPSLSSSSCPSPSSIPQQFTLNRVNYTLQAIAYQTLLCTSKEKHVVGGIHHMSKSQHWLRQRASSQLTHLATTNENGLAAIVSAFVPTTDALSSFGNELMNGAAQRLGRTLVAMTHEQTKMNSNSNNYNDRDIVKSQKQQKQNQKEKQIQTTMELQGMLCKQLLGLLAVVFPPITTTSKNKKTKLDNDVSISPRSMAIIQTAWSVLEHLSNENIEYHIIRPWTQQLIHRSNENAHLEVTALASSSMSIHKTIRQLGALCAFPPPYSAFVLRFLRRIATATNVDDCNVHNEIQDSSIFGQIYRIAILSSRKLSIFVSSKPADIYDDAEQALLWLTKNLYAGGVTANKEDKEQVIVTWLSVLKQTTWDWKGYHYYINTKDSINTTLEIGLYQDRQQTEVIEQFTNMVQSLTERCDFFVSNIVLALAHPSNYETKEKNDSLSSRMRDFPSRIFRFLLRCYILDKEDELSCANDTIKNDKAGDTASSSLKLIATILLPTLCEKCSQEQLLYGDNEENASELLFLIHEVLSNLAVSNRNKFQQECATTTDIDSSSKDTDFERCTISTASSGAVERMVLELDKDEEHRKEFLSSISSILLSMLITIIELGSTLRSTEEEKILQSFLPTLQSLSIITNAGDESVAAMADMAAYAMSLIASRKSSVSSTVNNDFSNQDDQINKLKKSTNAAVADDLSTWDKYRRILDQAEADLGSLHPPIRAKGMVSLGRLARGFQGILASTKESSMPSGIQELDESGNAVVGEGDNDDATFLIGEILHLSLAALNDEESYVYLAAIQTIVAVGDLYPRRVLPLLATSIVTGVVSLNKQPQAPLPSSSQPLPITSSIKLSQGQNIKLAESLIFIIRRRAVTDEYVPTIVNLMLYGRILLSQEDDRSNKNAVLIQKETDTYFNIVSDQQKDDDDEGDERAGREDGNDDDLQTKSDNAWEEKNIRLKTGGPIFDVEERDVVRSLRISVLSELVMSSSSSSSTATVISAYCKVFIRLIVEAFHLDGSSRAVTRSAAFLARELYTQLLRETESLETAINTGHNNNAFGGNDVGGGGYKTMTTAKKPAIITDIPFAVALVQSKDEELLFANLRNQYIDTDTSIVDDPTTIMRCKEAVSIRELAMKRGIYTAARLLIEERKTNLPEIVQNITKCSGGVKLFHLDPIKTLE